MAGCAVPHGCACMRRCAAVHGTAFIDGIIIEIGRSGAMYEVDVIVVASSGDASPGRRV